MKLSDVPFHQLVTTEGWLTGHNGKSGTIEKIISLKSGKFFETSLEIRWEDGKMSYPNWPDECDHVTVKDPQPTQCGPFIDAQLALLEKQKQYLEACRLRVFAQPA